MARNFNGSPGGSDAATIKPKLVPDYELLPRDDSGGPDYEGYTAEFGDSGFVQGAKAHLSAHGGSDDAEEQDEVSEAPRSRAANKADKGYKGEVNSEAPGKSKKLSRE